MPNPAFADRLALTYLRNMDIPAQRIDGRVVAYDCVHVKVLYSTPRMYGNRFYWNLPYRVAATCDVLMLLAADDGAVLRVFLFDPLDWAFYYADGRQKQYVTWVDDRIMQRQHEQRYEALTTPVMLEARDRLELIERAVKARG